MSIGSVIFSFLAVLALQPALIAAEPAAVPVVRPADVRPRFDDAPLNKLGITRYESTRLRLYTDLPEQVARTLPPLVDQVYAAWTAEFGDLPPAADGSDFQISGYLMRQPETFRTAGLLRDDLAGVLHGRQSGLEFWMHDQDLPYYREHLLLHEATHCFMTAVPGSRMPLWYLEGMAEHFGVHQTDTKGVARFGLFPDSSEGFEGFGRITVLNRDTRNGRFWGIGQISQWDGDIFAGQSSEPYAWSWALCEFLGRHPRYRERFHALSRETHRPDFTDELRRRFSTDSDALAIDWEQFVHHIIPGYDFERSAIEYRAGTPLKEKESTKLQIHADQGWQSTGVWLEANANTQLTAEGRIEVNNVEMNRAEKPWVSEANGITVRYVDGRPLGRLIAAIQSTATPGPNGEGSLLSTLDAGSNVILRTPVAGTLYLRVNDHWNSLADNAEAFTIRLERQSSPETAPHAPSVE